MTNRCQWWNPACRHARGPDLVENIWSELSTFKTWAIDRNPSFSVPLENSGPAVWDHVPPPGQLATAGEQLPRWGAAGGLVRFLPFLRAPPDPWNHFRCPPGPQAPLVSADCRVPGISAAAFAGTYKDDEMQKSYRSSLLSTGDPGTQV